MESILLVKSKGKQPSPEEMQQMLGNYVPWMQKHSANGNYLGGSPFQPNGVRIKNSGSHETDGDFLKLENLITGYIHLKTTTFDEALQIADDCPLLQCNEIEVRPVLDMK
ncbi:MAG: hypothetical protein DHS20C17_16980 [Cyclobacteriaceae bacterium]|nr:MAG: hypothetical protein DHS20C17_16980 [Cyclobacteriaceae bacterium]